LNQTPEYDLILVGSSFSSAFFLHRYLELAGSAKRRILVLEKGANHSREWLQKNDPRFVEESLSSVDFGTSRHWGVRIAFGGASNSWWACTPRMLPEDFELKSHYGVGDDWPINYQELEPFYCDAEEIMAVSGSSDSPSPRSRPYPAPPHLFSDPDKILKRKWGPLFVSQPNARARYATKRGRARCCAQGVCHRCPVDSKFTVLNELDWLWNDPRVEVVANAEVQRVDIYGTTARGVVFSQLGREKHARGEFIVLGANAIFNPFILIKSGLADRETGRGLCEQVGVNALVHLDGIDNFQGSTSITGNGYPFYSGSHRSTTAACLIETWNVPELRNQRGKYRQFLRTKFIFEDFRNRESRVEVSRQDPNKPQTTYRGPSDSTKRSANAVGNLVATFLEPLPLEGSVDLSVNASEGHILGTAVMGIDPNSSVVDRQLLHHRVRNLAVLGGSAFPTAAPANPTLTICALSLWSAQSVFGSAT
jgi:choline dehydrogenase-like flavoprotein